MKKALVLAGGIAQAALIQELKTRGYYTILCDMNPYCYAVKYADEFRTISAMDFDALEKEARDQHVDMVVTACADQILLAETYLCEKLGLHSYISYETAKLVSDKQYMKDIFIKNGIMTSRYVILDKYDEGEINKLTFPLIVKPVDAYSSKGVNRCNSLIEVKEHLAEAIEISRTKTAIVEEFKEGTELTVEAFIKDGKATLLCYGSKEKLKNGKFVSYGSLYPSNITDELKEKILNTAQQIADAFHLINSPMLIQFITDGKEAYVLEFCARTGGFIKYEIVKRMSGFDPIKAIVDLHEGKVPSVDNIKPEKNYLISCFLYCSEGTVDQYCGFQEMYDAGVIAPYWLVRDVGYTFEGIKSNGDRAACYLIQDDTYEGLMDKYQRAKESVKILDKNGRNLIRFDLM